MSYHDLIPSPAALAPRLALVTAMLATLAVDVPAQAPRLFEELPRHGLPLHNDNTAAIAAGDVDGDGDIDLVVANLGGNSNTGPMNGQDRLYLNDGRGSFTDATATQMPVANDYSYSVALGDVDGDGDLDAVFGQKLYRNDGAGTFTDVTPPNFGSGLLGDVDGDGDLDMVTAGALYLNDGSGVFTTVTSTHMPAVVGFLVCMALGDVDGDGDLDATLVTRIYGSQPGSWHTQNLLYVNNGNGVFADVTAVQLPPVVYASTLAVAFGDVDGDGDLDLVIGNDGSSTFYGTGGDRNRLYANDGFGYFTDVTASQMPPDTNPTQAIALADVDGDGDLDLICCNSGTASGGSVDDVPNRLWWNDGTGTFAAGQNIGEAWQWSGPGASTRSSSVAIADLDGDDDLDVVFGNQPAGQFSDPGQNRVYRNLQRQLHAPAKLRIGETYTLDAYLRYGPPVPITFALPYVSFAPASIPLPPFGTLGIDPTQAVALPLIQIPQPGGVGSVNVQIVHDPGLLGLSIYSQALVVPYPHQARLSNVEADTAELAFAPTITAIAPSVAGAGTPVTITGGVFQSGVTLKVGGNPTPISSWNATTVTFQMPPGAGCDTAIEVANVGSEAASQVMNRTPVVTYAQNATGPAMGGAPFEIQGEYLLGATVTFNGVPLTNVTSQTASAISGQTPPGAVGPAVVAVSNAIACQTTVPYTYHATPTITSIAPMIAAPGTPVTIHGSNFLSGLVLTVGGNPTPITAWTATTVSFQMPPGGGCNTLVEVTNVGNLTASQTMNRAPSVTSVPYTTGPAMGGGPFEVHGQDLLGATVTFGGVPMTNITSQSATAIVGSAPPGAVGPATVVISNALACQATAIYTYHATPTITTIAPAVAGPGTPVTIHGSNFLSGLVLTVGGNPAPITAWTATAVSFQMPPGNGCDTLVAITNVGNVTASMMMNRTPVVTSAPNGSGPAAGGALFVVTGQHLAGATITFNGVPMTNIQTQTASLVLGYTPPGAVGPATVVVSNAIGCSTSVQYVYQ